MSAKSFNDFRAAIATDQTLEAAVRKAYASGSREEVESLVDLAKSRGFDFTAAEAQGVLDETELSDLELELVTGGAPVNCDDARMGKV
jgi:predicted ribosomally synthesized peptide with nif11-like leader